MGALCRTMDWEASPLGGVGTWPPALRIAAGTAVECGQPMAVLWGADLVTIYNDAFRSLLGDEHPGTLGTAAAGRSGSGWWPDDAARAAVLAGGSVTVPARPFPAGATGPRAASFKLGYSPLRDEAGDVAGVLVTAAPAPVPAGGGRTEDELFRFITEGARDYAILTIDADGRIESWSPGAAAVFGWTADEVIGQPVAMTFTPEDRARGAPERELAMAREHGAAPNVRWHMRRDGSRVFIEGSMRALTPAGDGAPRFIKVGQDVTERRRVEQALRDSESRYRTLFDSIDEGFCILQLIFDDADRPVDYRYIEVNPAFERQTGMVGALGRTIRELVPAIEPFWFDIYGKVALTGRPTRFVDHAESMGRWFDVYAFRIGEPERRQVAVLFSDITERKQSELERDRLLGELRLERERLANVFEQAPAVLAVMRGRDHVIELANEAYFQLVGRRDLIGRPVADALPEIVGQGFIDLMNRVLQTGQPYIGREVPVRLARAGDAPLEERFLDFSYIPILETDGTRSGVIAHGMDVTDHVRARHEIERLLRASERDRAAADQARAEAEAASAQLRSSEARFRAVFEHAALGVGRVRFSDARWIDVNEALSAMVGLTREEMLNTPWPEITHPDDLHLDLVPFRRMAKGELDRYTVEKRYIHRDGHHVWARLSLSLVRDADGRPDYEVAVVEDVTERRAAEADRDRLLEAVLRSEERYALIRRATNEVIWDWELATDELTWNEALETTFGYSRDEIEPGIGFWYDRIHPDDRGRATESIHGAIEGDATTWSGEYRFRRADGTYAAVYDRGVIARSESGIATRMIGSMLDVSERERLLASEREARHEAEAANRAKADFLASMSHELRTPLNAIGGYVDLLDLGVHGPLTDAQRSALARVAANQRHLLGLINDVLAFAKLEAGQVEFDLRPLAACDLLDDVHRLVAPLAELKHISIDTRQSDEPLMVLGDEERVRQVLLNLVGNAIKFTHEGGRITLTTRHVTDRVDIDVRDDGPGIAPEKQDSIFDAFVQVDRRLSRPQEGVGLGLAISRDLARGMGGDVRVDSAPGQGSTFTLSLPAAPPERERDR
jgi:PAS domain S-box-containing protein